MGKLKKMYLSDTNIISIYLRWIWECDTKSNSCQRKPRFTSSDSFYENVDICRLVCDPKGNIWPQPSNFSVTNHDLVYIAVQ